MNVKFLADIIDGYIYGLNDDLARGIITKDEHKHKTEVLGQLKDSVIHFIKDLNKL